MDVWPVAVVVDRAGHDVQAALEMMLLYVPTGHSEHPCVAEPVRPGLHRHSLTDVEPGCSVCEPVGHCEHVPAPVLLLYVFSAHAAAASPGAAAGLAWGEWDNGSGLRTGFGPYLGSCSSRPAC